LRRIQILYGIIAYLPALFLLSACSATTAEAPPEEAAAVAADSVEAIAVRVTPVERRAFPLRTLATGRLRAARKAEIRLRAAGEIVELPVAEGAYVEQGALLARVDEAALRLRLRQAQLQLDDAEINKQDLLLAQGGQAGVDTSVTPEKLALIHTLSGYDKARLAVEQAEFELAQARVEAPFGGLVADLEVKLHQQAGAGDVLCTLLDPAGFEAEFQLLESEALPVEPGRRVRVRPLALPGREWPAAVSTINPVVDDQGLVTLRARLQGDTRRLFEGMNVEVVLEQAVPGLIVVPKSALVLRSGRPVVFTYAPEEGLAKWNYVTVAHENDEQIALSEGLEPGALVINEGNLNLEHDAQVRVDTLK
jgi:RND family efflux transporter MFP subunit